MDHNRPISFRIQTKRGQVNSETVKNKIDTDYNYTKLSGGYYVPYIEGRRLQHGSGVTQMVNQIMPRVKTDKDPIAHSGKKRSRSLSRTKKGYASKSKSSKFENSLLLDNHPRYATGDLMGRKVDSNLLGKTSEERESQVQNMFEKDHMFFNKAHNKRAQIIGHKESGNTSLNHQLDDLHDQMVTSAIIGTLEAPKQQTSPIIGCDITSPKQCDKIYDSDVKVYKSKRAYLKSEILSPVADLFGRMVPFRKLRPKHENDKPTNAITNSISEGGVFIPEDTDLDGTFDPTQATIYIDSFKNDTLTLHTLQNNGTSSWKLSQERNNMDCGVPTIHNIVDDPNFGITKSCTYNSNGCFIPETDTYNKSIHSKIPTEFVSQIQCPKANAELIRYAVGTKTSDLCPTKVGCQPDLMTVLGKGKHVSEEHRHRMHHGDITIGHGPACLKYVTANYLANIDPDLAPSRFLDVNENSNQPQSNISNRSKNSGAADSRTEDGKADLSSTSEHSLKSGVTAAFNFLGLNIKGGEVGSDSYDNDEPTYNVHTAQMACQDIPDISLAPGKSSSSNVNKLSYKVSSSNQGVSGEMRGSHGGKWRPRTLSNEAMGKTLCQESKDLKVTPRQKTLNNKANTAPSRQKNQNHDSMKSESPSKATNKSVKSSWRLRKSFKPSDKTDDTKTKLYSMETRAEKDTHGDYLSSAKHQVLSQSTISSFNRDKTNEGVLIAQSEAISKTKQPKAPARSVGPATSPQKTQQRQSTASRSSPLSQPLKPQVRSGDPKANPKKNPRRQPTTATSSQSESTPASSKVLSKSPSLIPHLKASARSGDIRTRPNTTSHRQSSSTTSSLNRDQQSTSQVAASQKISKPQISESFVRSKSASASLNKTPKRQSNPAKAYSQTHNLKDPDSHRRRKNSPSPLRYRVRSRSSSTESRSEGPTDLPKRSEQHRSNKKDKSASRQNSSQSINDANQSLSKRQSMSTSQSLSRNKSRSRSRSSSSSRSKNKSRRPSRPMSPWKVNNLNRAKKSLRTRSRSWSRSRSRSRGGTHKKGRSKSVKNTSSSSSIPISKPPPRSKSLASSESSQLEEPMPKEPMPKEPTPLETSRQGRRSPHLLGEDIIPGPGFPRKVNLPEIEQPPTLTESDQGSTQMSATKEMYTRNESPSAPVLGTNDKENNQQANRNGGGAYLNDRKGKAFKPGNGIHTKSSEMSTAKTLSSPKPIYTSTSKVNRNKSKDSEDKKLFSSSFDTTHSQDPGISPDSNETKKRISSEIEAKIMAKYMTKKSTTQIPLLPSRGAIETLQESTDISVKGIMTKGHTPAKAAKNQKQTGDAALSNLPFSAEQSKNTMQATENKRRPDKQTKPQSTTSSTEFSDMQVKKKAAREQPPTNTATIQTKRATLPNVHRSADTTNDSKRNPTTNLKTPKRATQSNVNSFNSKTDSDKKQDITKTYLPKGSTPLNHKPSNRLTESSELNFKQIVTEDPNATSSMNKNQYSLLRKSEVTESVKRNPDGLVVRSISTMRGRSPAKSNFPRTTSEMHHPWLPNVVKGGIYPNSKDLPKINPSRGEENLLLGRISPQENGSPKSYVSPRRNETLSDDNERTNHLQTAIHTEETKSISDEHVKVQNTHVDYQRLPEKEAATEVTPKDNKTESGRSYLGSILHSVQKFVSPKKFAGIKNSLSPPKTKTSDEGKTGDDTVKTQKKDIKEAASPPKSKQSDGIIVEHESAKAKIGDRKKTGDSPKVKHGEEITKDKSTAKIGITSLKKSRVTQNNKSTEILSIDCDTAKTENDTKNKIGTDKLIVEDKVATTKTENKLTTANASISSDKLISGGKTAKINIDNERLMIGSSVDKIIANPKKTTAESDAAMAESKNQKPIVSSSTEKVIIHGDTKQIKNVPNEDIVVQTIFKSGEGKTVNKSIEIYNFNQACRENTGTPLRSHLVVKPQQDNVHLDVGDSEILRVGLHSYGKEIRSVVVSGKLAESGTVAISNVAINGNCRKYQDSKVNEASLKHQTNKNLLNKHGAKQSEICEGHVGEAATKPLSDKNMRESPKSDSQGSRDEEFGVPVELAQCDPPQLDICEPAATFKRLSTNNSYIDRRRERQNSRGPSFSRILCNPQHFSGSSNDDREYKRQRIRSLSPQASRRRSVSPSCSSQMGRSQVPWYDHQSTTSPSSSQCSVLSDRNAISIRGSDSSISVNSESSVDSQQGPIYNRALFSLLCPVDLHFNPPPNSQQLFSNQMHKKGRNGTRPKTPKKIGPAPLAGIFGTSDPDALSRPTIPKDSSSEDGLVRKKLRHLDVTPPRTASVFYKEEVKPGTDVLKRYPPLSSGREPADPRSYGWGPSTSDQITPSYSSVGSVISRNKSWMPPSRQFWAWAQQPKPSELPGAANGVDNGTGKEDETSYVKKFADIRGILKPEREQNEYLPRRRAWLNTDPSYQQKTAENVMSDEGSVKSEKHSTAKSQTKQDFFSQAIASDRRETPDKLSKRNRKSASPDNHSPQSSSAQLSEVPELNRKGRVSRVQRVKSPKIDPKGKTVTFAGIFSDRVHRSAPETHTEIAQKIMNIPVRDRMPVKPKSPEGVKKENFAETKPNAVQKSKNPIEVEKQVSSGGQAIKPGYAVADPDGILHHPKVPPAQTETPKNPDSSNKMGDQQYPHGIDQNKPGYVVSGPDGFWYYHSYRDYPAKPETSLNPDSSNKEVGEQAQHGADQNNITKHSATAGISNNLDTLQTDSKAGGELEHSQIAEDKSNSERSKSSDLKNSTKTQHSIQTGLGKVTIGKDDVSKAETMVRSSEQRSENNQNTFVDPQKPAISEKIHISEQGKPPKEAQEKCVTTPKSPVRSDNAETLLSKVQDKPSVRADVSISEPVQKTPKSDSEKGAIITSVFSKPFSSKDEITDPNPLDTASAKKNNEMSVPPNKPTQDISRDSASLDHTNISASSPSQNKTSKADANAKQSSPLKEGSEGDKIEKRSMKPIKSIPVIKGDGEINIAEPAQPQSATPEVKMDSDDQKIEKPCITQTESKSLKTDGKEIQCAESAQSQTTPKEKVGSAGENYDKHSTTGIKVPSLKKDVGDSTQPKSRTAKQSRPWASLKKNANKSTPTQSRSRSRSRSKSASPNERNRKPMPVDRSKSVQSKNLKTDNSTTVPSPSRRKSPVNKRSASPNEHGRKSKTTGLKQFQPPTSTVISRKDNVSTLTPTMQRDRSPTPTLIIVSPDPLATETEKETPKIQVSTSAENKALKHTQEKTSSNIQDKAPDNRQKKTSEHTKDIPASLHADTDQLITSRPLPENNVVQHKTGTPDSSSKSTTSDDAIGKNISVIFGAFRDRIKILKSPIPRSNENGSVNASRLEKSNKTEHEGKNRTEEKSHETVEPINVIKNSVGTKVHEEGPMESGSTESASSAELGSSSSGGSLSSEASSCSDYAETSSTEDSSPGRKRYTAVKKTDSRDSLPKTPVNDKGHNHQNMLKKGAGAEMIKDSSTPIEVSIHQGVPKGAPPPISGKVQQPSSKDAPREERQATPLFSSLRDSLTGAISSNLKSLERILIGEKPEESKINNNPTEIQSKHDPSTTPRPSRKYDIPSSLLERSDPAIPIDKDYDVSGSSSDSDCYTSGCNLKEQAKEAIRQGREPDFHELVRYKTYEYGYKKPTTLIEYLDNSMDYTAGNSGLVNQSKIPSPDEQKQEDIEAVEYEDYKLAKRVYEKKQLNNQRLFDVLVISGDPSKDTVVHSDIACMPSFTAEEREQMSGDRSPGRTARQSYSKQALGKEIYKNSKDKPQSTAWSSPPPTPRKHVCTSTPSRVQSTSPVRIGKSADTQHPSLFTAPKGEKKQNSRPYSLKRNQSRSPSPNAQRNHQHRSRSPGNNSQRVSEPMRRSVKKDASSPIKAPSLKKEVKNAQKSKSITDTTSLSDNANSGIQNDKQALGRKKRPKSAVDVRINDDSRIPISEGIQHSTENPGKKWFWQRYGGWLGWGSEAQHMAESKDDINNSVNGTNCPKRPENTVTSSEKLEKGNVSTNIVSKPVAESKSLNVPATNSSVSNPKPTLRSTSPQKSPNRSKSPSQHNVGTSVNTQKDIETKRGWFPLVSWLSEPKDNEKGEEDKKYTPGPLQVKPPTQDQSKHLSEVGQLPVSGSKPKQCVNRILPTNARDGAEGDGCVIPSLKNTPAETRDVSASSESELESAPEENNPLQVLGGSQTITAQIASNSESDASASGSFDASTSEVRVSRTRRIFGSLKRRIKRITRYERRTDQLGNTEPCPKPKVEKVLHHVACGVPVVKTLRGNPVRSLTPECDIVRSLSTDCLMKTPDQKPDIHENLKELFFQLDSLETEIDHSFNTQRIPSIVFEDALHKYESKLNSIHVKPEITDESEDDIIKGGVITRPTMPDTVFPGLWCGESSLEPGQAEQDDSDTSLYYGPKNYIMNNSDQHKNEVERQDFKLPNYENDSSYADDEDGSDDDIEEIDEDEDDDEVHDVKVDGGPRQSNSGLTAPERKPSEYNANSLRFSKPESLRLPASPFNRGMQMCLPDFPTPQECSNKALVNTNNISRNNIEHFESTSGKIRREAWCCNFDKSPRIIYERKDRIGYISKNMTHSASRINCTPDDRHLNETQNQLLKHNLTPLENKASEAQPFYETYSSPRLTSPSRTPVCRGGSRSHIDSIPSFNCDACLLADVTVKPLPYEGVSVVDNDQSDIFNMTSKDQHRFDEFVLGGYISSRHKKATQSPDPFQTSPEKDATMISYGPSVKLNYNDHLLKNTKKSTKSCLSEKIPPRKSADRIIKSESNQSISNRSRRKSPTKKVRPLTVPFKSSIPKPAPFTFEEALVGKFDAERKYVDDAIERYTQARIFASFENFMQEKKPCYVENCGFNKQPPRPGDISSIAQELLYPAREEQRLADKGSGDSNCHSLSLQPCVGRVWASAKPTDSINHAQTSYEDTGEVNVVKDKVLCWRSVKASDASDELYDRKNALTDDESGDVSVCSSSSESSCASNSSHRNYNSRLGVCGDGVASGDVARNLPTNMLCDKLSDGFRETLRLNNICQQDDDQDEDDEEEYEEDDDSEDDSEDDDEEEDTEEDEDDGGDDLQATEC